MIRFGGVAMPHLGKKLASSSQEESVALIAGRWQVCARGKGGVLAGSIRPVNLSPQ